MPDGTRLRNSRRRALHPFMGRPELVKRMLNEYDMYLKGMTYADISEIVGVTAQTVVQDIKRARAVLKERAGADLEGIQADAVRSRELIQLAAFDDRDTAQPDDAAGRAALLRVVSDNQTSKEELLGLRKKDKSSPTGSVFVVNVSGQEKSLPELTDEELAQVRGQLVDGTATEVPEVPEQPDRADEG